MTSHDTHENSSFWKSRTGIALCAFVAIAAVLLILEHRAHALQWLPIALLLACSTKRSAQDGWQPPAHMHGCAIPSISASCSS
jgi:hypothetical protein